jgi:SAM-dependent methyltransferase
VKNPTPSSADLLKQITRARGVIPSPPLPPAATFVKDASVVYKDLEGREQRVDVTPGLEKDPFPIPPTAEREEYGGPNHHNYWLSGFYDWLRVREAVGRHGGGWEGVRSVFDLGCSSGRVLRHLVCQGDVHQCWGADIDAGNVEWVRKHLPNRIRVFQNSMIPHLPLPDASLDLFTAFSVFTHIDVFEMAWILEVRRILKPGGIAYISVHTERTWRRVADRDDAIKRMIVCQPATPEYRIDKDLFLAPMPEQRIVFRRSGATLLCNIFHAEEYLRSYWGRVFDIRAIYDGAVGGFQDVLVLRRPAEGE